MTEEQKEANEFELTSVRDYKFELDESTYSQVQSQSMDTKMEPSFQNDNYDEMIYKKFNSADLNEEEKEREDINEINNGGKFKYIIINNNNLYKNNRIE
jgi:hypothetical protein